MIGKRNPTRRRHGGAAVLLGLFAVLLVPAADAATTDRVQVGRPGQNATAGYPLALYTSVELLPDYTGIGSFDGESRNWEGPAYESGGLGGTSTIDWQVTFVRGGTADSAAQGALAISWPVAERPSVSIPHRIGSRVVGSIPAAALLTKAPGDNNAQFESVLAFPLCRGLFATTKFSVLNPGSEYASDPSTPFLVSGVPARTWNHDHALRSLGQVTLDGYLPVGRVSARAAGRIVRGTVRDCRGDAMAGVAVRLMNGRSSVARAPAAADGSFRLLAPHAGRYRVEVALTVTGKGGSGTRRTARWAAVTVR